jgi:putative aldouronate transport system permease protein
MHKRHINSDTIFDIVNFILLTIALFSVLYPLYFVVIASISDPNAVNTGQTLLWPKQITLNGYERILRDSRIWTGYRNSIVYLVLGTTINLTLTIPAAYALSRKDLLGRGPFMVLLAFTMFFSGGIIPRYLLIRNLGMLNTVWAMIIPPAAGVWNIIITRTYFQSTIPQELLEAAYMDGCSNRWFFFKVALPLSKPIIAVMLLFYGVMHWNSFMPALLYIRDPELHPLQLVLRDILIASQMSQEITGGDFESAGELQRIADLVKHGLIIVASLPVLLLYPFLQRYFVQGVMIGSIKG